ncbi:hypothetical protein [Streptomyces sp. NPDC002516]
MSARPEVICFDEASTAAAMERALDALAEVLAALGDGEHTLSIASQRADGALVSRTADISLTTAPVRMAILDQADYLILDALLVFALEGSSSAVLIATTAAEPRPRTCGWTVRDGWLHPMDTAELRAAVTPCPGSSAVDREVYPAPPLPEPPATDEETGRA